MLQFVVVGQRCTVGIEQAVGTFVKPYQHEAWKASARGVEGISTNVGVCQALLESLYPDDIQRVRRHIEQNAAILG